MYEYISGEGPSCPVLSWLGLLIRNEIYYYGKHAGHWTGSLGACRRSRLPALLIYIVDFYQRRHVNVVVVLGRVLVLVPVGVLSVCACLCGCKHPRLISNTCNECLNCHYHLQCAESMFFGCHVSKYCTKISSALGKIYGSVGIRIRSWKQPRASCSPHSLLEMA